MLQLGFQNFDPQFKKAEKKTSFRFQLLLGQISGFRFLKPNPVLKHQVPTILVEVVKIQTQNITFVIF